MKNKASLAKGTSARTVAGHSTPPSSARLLPLLLVLLALPSAAQAQFNFTTNNGAITITGYTGAGGNVAIPSIIAGLPVISIGTNAFYNRTNLTSVTIPDSVTNVGDWAFYGCANLTGVTLGNGVSRLGSKAFGACKKLTSATLPSNITTIGSGAFVGCSSLTAITVDALNSSYASLDGILFNQNKTILIEYPAGKAGRDYQISNSVTSIGDLAFGGCTSLTNITVPNSITNIGDGTFNGCLGLISVTLPDTISSIGDSAFQFCIKLTTAKIPNGVSRIGSYAFHACSGLLSATVPNSVTNIGDSAFRSCGLTNVMIGSSVISIGSNAFNSCFNLKNVYFQGNAPSADTSVFQSSFSSIVCYLAGTTGWGPTFAGRPTVLWTPLAPFTYTTNNGAITITGFIGSGGEIIIPDTIAGLPVARIGDNSLAYRVDLSSVTIPNSVTSIGSKAFLHCIALTNVTGANGVVSIEDDAFSECTKLTSFAIGGGVTNLGKSAFAYCQSLPSATIPKSLTNIGDAAFVDCISLSAITVDALNPVYSSLDGVLFNKNQTTLVQYPPGRAGSYTIPEGVSIIGGGRLTFLGGAFSFCRGLTSVTIPNSVTTIGDYAFNCCTALTSVTIPNSVTTIGMDAFGGCTSMMNVTIGNRVTSIGRSAFWDCGLTSVTIPNSVTIIGDWAFTHCLSLTNAIILNYATIIGEGAFSDCPQLHSITIPSRMTSLGVQTNQFGFTPTGASNAAVVVEACTDLANPVWAPVGTNSLTSGSSSFSDPQWTNYPSRFYRLRSP